MSGTEEDKRWEHTLHCGGPGLYLVRTHETRACGMGEFLELMPGRGQGHIFYGIATHDTHDALSIHYHLPTHKLRKGART